MAKKKKTRLRPDGLRRGEKIPPRKIQHIAAKLRDLAVAISVLRPDEDNARKHEKVGIAAIAGSLERFGQQTPIVVNAEGMVVAGSGRLAAARSLGWEYIAAVRTNLTGAELRAYGLAENRTGDLSKFDPDILARQVAELAAEGEELVRAAGFTDEDLAKLLDDGEKREPEIGECWQVVVECDSEKGQKALFDRLRKEGLKCKTLIL